MRNLIPLVAVCLLLAFGSAADAVLITNGMGKVLLDDDFELPVPGSPPNNGTFPGTWSRSVGGAGSAVEVIDTAIPGPVYGNQYAHMARGYSGGAVLTGQLAQTVSSGTLHAEFMANVTSTSEAAFGISGAADGYYSAQVWVMTRTTGKIQYVGSSGWEDTGLTYSPGNWQTWAIDADMDAKTYTLTVDGASTTLPFKTGAPAAAGYFSTRVNSGPTSGQVYQYYLDQAVHGPFNEWHAANGAMPNASPGFGMRNPEYISLADGVLTINDTSNGYPQVLNVAPWPSLAPMFPNDAFSETEEYMVDFDMRIVSLENASSVTHRVIVDDGKKRVNVSWIKNASDQYMVSLYAEGAGGNLAVSDPGTFDPRQFHDYRLEKRLTDRTPGSAKGMITLYADGQMLLSAPYESFGGATTNYLAIGTGSSTGNGHSQWKSFRYNSRDNFLPDPEPAVIFNASTANPVLPDAVAKDPWLHQITNNAPTPSYVDGALRLEVNGGQYNRYYREEPGILLPDGTGNNLVAEWSMQLSRFDGASGTRVVIDEGTGGRRVQAVITGSQIGLVPEGSGGSSAVWDTSLDPFDWHNYRLIKNVGADTVDLFVDDMSMPLLSLDYSKYGFTGTPTPQIGFGWTYSGANGAADFGYFRYRLGTTLIPEPSSVTLLLGVALAAFAAGGVRRRRGREHWLQRTP